MLETFCLADTTKSVEHKLLPDVLMLLEGSKREINAPHAYPELVRNPSTRPKVGAGRGN